MSSTSNATWRRPKAFAGACPSPLWTDGAWNFTSSIRPWPSRVCIVAISACTPSRPTTRSTQPPSTCPSPCNMRPSSVKKATAAEGRRRLAGQAETEAFAEDIQRVVVLAVPVVRTLARGARWTRVPWLMVVSSAISIGVAVRTGVRELQVLASLVAYRLEQTTGAPGDPALVEKLAIDLYLNPKRTPRLADDKLRVVRLTRKWVLSGVFGRKTSKRASKALDAAERLDAASLSARWAAIRQGSRPVDRQV